MRIFDTGSVRSPIATAKVAIGRQGGEEGDDAGRHVGRGIEGRPHRQDVAEDGDHHEEYEVLQCEPNYAAAPRDEDRVHDGDEHERHQQHVELGTAALHRELQHCELKPPGHSHEQKDDQGPPATHDYSDPQRLV